MPKPCLANQEPLPFPVHLLTAHMNNNTVKRQSIYMLEGTLKGDFFLKLQTAKAGTSGLHFFCSLYISFSRTLRGDLAGFGFGVLFTQAIFL